MSSLETHTKKPSDDNSSEGFLCFWRSANRSRNVSLHQPGVGENRADNHNQADYVNNGSHIVSFHRS